MCRLVAGVAWSPGGSELLGRLAWLVAEAAAGDPYLRAVTGGEDRHCHGYGFLLVYRGVGGGAWRIVYERYDALEEGLDGEEACRANLEAARGAAERLRGLLASAGEAVLVFHVRRAGRREPRGTLNVHPYVEAAYTAGGVVELYLAHNGGVRKDALARALGLPEGVEGVYTDSRLLLGFVARRVSSGVEAWRALAEGYAYVKSGYDVALAVLRDTGRGPEPGLLLAAGMAPGLDEARRRYYEPVGFHAGGAAGYISSTVRDLAAREGLPLETRSLDPGVYAVEPRSGLRLLERF